MALFNFKIFAEAALGRDQQKRSASAPVYSPWAAGSGLVKKQKVVTKDDLFRTRLLFKIIFVLAFAAILSLVYIWTRVQIVEFGYQINDLNRHSQQLTEENKRLKVEVATLSSPKRLQKLATEKIGMKLPDESQIRPIEATLP